MADAAAPQKTDDGFDDAKFQEQIKAVREAIEKQDTPAGHGALGEILYRTERENYQAEAIPELQIAADAGIPAAKAYLGDAYFNGKGVEKDVAKGMDLFYDAALDGDVDSMYSIGAAYFMGKDVDADYEKAREFLSDAASKGNNRAMNVLGLIYLGGFGVEQNIPKAKRYFQKAMEHNNVHGKQNLDMIKKQGRRFDYHGFILSSFQKEEETQ